MYQKVILSLLLIVLFVETRWLFANPLDKSTSSIKLEAIEKNELENNVEEKQNTKESQRKGEKNVDEKSLEDGEMNEKASKERKNKIMAPLRSAVESSILSIPYFSNDTKFWKNNKTHEIALPFKKPEDCSSGIVCKPMILSWERTIDIQSDDVLSIEINDTFLKYNQTAKSKNTASVYTVTRLGYENCDITEGELLDTNVQTIEDRKILNLYENDLTEGSNLLIVVSDEWFVNHCVRLNINMKSNDCGDNADCSGKGLCFTNSSMEGYECSCFSNFVGSHCEEIDACLPTNPCINNGICIDFAQGHNGNKFQCLCPYGFHGSLCNLQYQKCDINPCLNGGQCYNRSGEAYCECFQGYQGKRCEFKFPCDNNPCKNGGTCWTLDHLSFLCSCQPGYRGINCEVEPEKIEANSDDRFPLLIVEAINEHNLQESRKSFLVNVALSLFITLTIIGAIFAGAICAKRRRKLGKNNMSFSENVNKYKSKAFSMFTSRVYRKKYTRKAQKSNSLNFILYPNNASN